MGRQRKSPFHPLWSSDPEPIKRKCDHPDCQKAGEYRAPKDKTLKEYYWFCLEHVQAYNAQWNYYADMSEDEIEQELKGDYGWQRPTWDMKDRVSSRLFGDPLGLKKEAFGDEKIVPKNKQNMIDPALAAAAKVLEVSFPLELKEVRVNYKRLAKSYHPDSNGGDKTLEEKFKDVTEAYRLIMTVLNY